MKLVYHGSFLFLAFCLCLGLFRDTVEAASCPSIRINVSEVCENVESIDVNISANLTHVVCDNLQNLSQVNSSFIIRALEFALRRKYDLPQDIVKVLVSQVNGQELMTALEEFNEKVANSSLISNEAKSVILRALWDEKLRNEDHYNETVFVTSWFQKRLRLFISAVPTEMLQCLHNETMHCGQYQAIIKGLDVEFLKMNHDTQYEVYSSFQLPFLMGLNSNGSACTEGLNSTSWLTINFGRFRQYAKYKELVSLNSRFSDLDVLKMLTVKQLGQMSAVDGALKTRKDVDSMMGLIKTSALTEYIDEFSRQDIHLSPVVQASLLEHVLMAAQPLFQKTEDEDFIVWMVQYLPKLMPGMNASLVPLLFDALETRNCSAISAVVSLLNGSLGEFDNATRQSIYEAILSVISASSLRCYASNTSFSVFLEEMFQGFSDLLTLKDLETLIPTSDHQKIVNTIPPDVLANLFSREGFLNDDPFLTAVLKIYNNNDLFIDGFNQKDIIDILPNSTKASLLAGVWPSVVSSDDVTEVAKWLDGRLAPYFMFLDGSMLNTTETLNTSCVTFQKIVRKLNEDMGLLRDKEEEIYFSIKAYLIASKSRPRCHNAREPEASNWLTSYLGNYIRYSSARDMRLLTNNNATMFQDFAFNRDTLELINRNKIRGDLAAMYAAALFAVDADFSLNALPDQLLCFAQRSALIPRLNPEEALNFIAQVNLHCSSSRPSASERQLASMLVAQVKTLDKQTLVAFGQQAVGLTTGQISSLRSDVLVDPKVLESLGQVKGWNRGQSQMLLNKILRNYKLDTAEKFVQLGTLVEGLPGHSFDKMTAGLAIQLVKNVSFLGLFREAPEHLKKAFVGKILSNASSPGNALNNIPDDLAKYVPNSLLDFRGEIPDLRWINAKQWSPQQAEVLFGDILSRTDNYTELSPFILQGFQCNTASKLMPWQLNSLVQEVKLKNANLSEEQLSCMARLLIKDNLTANLSSYPADVLLFLPLSKVDHQNCNMFYSLASKGNLSLLANGLSHRTRILESALRCFGVTNTSLSKEQLRKLGVFVCDMEPTTFTESDPAVLENVKRCPDLTAAQRTALNILLGSGKTLYGAPASWDEATLNSLGPLAFYLNHTTWDAIHQEERTIFFRNIADGFNSQSASQRDKEIFFLKLFGLKPVSSPRAKRATEPCDSGPITASVLEDPMLIVLYETVQQFDACLSNEVLKDNLGLLREQPLPNGYLNVVKRKLDEIYTDGIPEDQLNLLGVLSRLYSPDQIGRWNITSRDTLAALLDPMDGAWQMSQLRSLVTRYMELGGELTAPLLDILGGKYLCYLDEDQLQNITQESIRLTEKLNISTCSQTKKDLLYKKAHSAFASQEGNSTYYPLIQPYLGGAPVEELKKLARSAVAMDINTFVNLNPEELKKLSVQDVKDLLGVNLPDLKKVEHHPSVAMWIKNHFQSELDTLGIGLTGGMVSSVGSTEASTSVDTKDNIIPTIGSSIITITNATFSDPGNFPNTTFSSFTSSSMNSLTSRIESHSTPAFKVTIVANETSAFTVSSNRPVSAIAKDPKDVFPTDMLSNATSVPDNTTDGIVVLTTARSIASSNSITADSNRTTTTRIESSTRDGTPASFTATDMNIDTSNEPTGGSNNSAAISSISPDTFTSVPTKAVIPFLNITAKLNDTLGGTAVSPFSNTTGVVVNRTTSSNIAVDFNSTTQPSMSIDSTTVLLTITFNVSLVGPSVSSTATINETIVPNTPTDINTTPSVDTTVASDSNTISHTAFRTTAINKTTFHLSTISINSTAGTGTTHNTTSILSSMNKTSVLPSVSSQHTPNATTPTLVSKNATEITDKVPTLSSKATLSFLETSSKGSSSVQTMTKAATTMQRSSSRASSRTKPPAHPTMNGYLNIKPLDASAASTSFSWTLLPLSLMVGIAIQKKLL